MPLYAATRTDLTTTPTADGAVAVIGTSASGSPSDHAHPRDRWTASDYGFLTQTYDPGVTNNNAVPSSGVLQLARVHLPTAQTVTNVILFVFTAGTSLTTSNCIAGLYTAAGAKVDVTADQSVAWATTGLKTMALVGSHACAAGDYYVAWWSNNSAGTNPAFLRGGTSAAVNVNLSAPNFRFATADGSLTNAASAPSSLGTQTASNNGWWAALS